MEPLQGLEALGEHGVGPKGVNIFCLCRNGDRKRRSQNQKEERKNGQGIPPRYTGLKTVYFHFLLVQQSFSFGSPQQATGGGFRVLTLPQERRRFHLHTACESHDHLCKKHNRFPYLADEMEVTKVKQLIKDTQAARNATGA